MGPPVVERARLEEGPLELSEQIYVFRNLTKTFSIEYDGDLKSITENK
jgi:hypothetical protein